MEEKKLTSEELITAIKNCADFYHGTCGISCPHKIQGSCRQYLMGQILDLIHRLQGENEALREGRVITQTVDYCADDLAKALKTIDDQKAEIRQLKLELNAAYEDRVDICKKLAEQKSEIERLEDKVTDFARMLRKSQKQVDELTEERDKLQDMLAEILIAINVFKEEQPKAEGKARDLIDEMIQQAVKDTAKEIFDKIFEVISCFATQGKSQEYNEGYIDCLAEVDKRLQNLAKERFGVEVE